MNRNKNLLILYYLWKKLSKFSNAQKKVFLIFFQLCSIANSKFSFYISLCAINCIKIKTMSLVLNVSIYFSRDSLCFIYFDVIIPQRLKKKFKHGTGITCKKSLVICATQLAGGLLLKILKYFKVMLNIFEFSHVKEIVES